MSFIMHNMVTAKNFDMNMKLHHMDIQTAMLDRTNLNINGSPKVRPIPTFFAEKTTFSTKKEKQTPRMPEVFPPKPPIKSCPPISRLRPQRKQEYGARVISFINVNNDPSIVSKHYDVNKMDLYFEQCFVIEGNLGCGSFGKVYKVKSREDGKYYAVKKSREKFKGEADRNRKLQEVAKHEELPPHPNCVQFYRAWEEKQHLYIQIELCQMSLSKYADTHHNIPEDIIWQFLVDLLQAVKHLHDRNLVHMDIKPENIFISYDNTCKLGDFGLSLDLSNSDLREAQEGDPKYLAPEVLKGKFTRAADLFSLGMTILELATDLDVPRGGDAWHQLRIGKLPADIKHNLSDDLVNIIVKMIDPNYLTRPSVDELLNMPIIKRIIATRKRKIYINNIKTRVYSIFNCILRLTLTMIYFIINPFRKLYPFHKGSLTHPTSTPKRDMESATELIQTNLMSADDDENDVANLHNNDSFSTHNNSLAYPLNFDTSSSFSDNSDVSSSKPFSSRKLRTEPTKGTKQSMCSYATTPTKTPPSTFSYKSYSADLTPTKILGPARQKLVFDENDVDQITTKIDINKTQKRFSRVFTKAK